MDINLNTISTEEVNPLTATIDSLSTLDLVSLINSEDKKVALAVEKELPSIAKMVDLITKAFLNGGRLIYLGAGTSGRLAVLDASECPPTYGVSDDLVIGLIAGGDRALRHAIEGAEDSMELGVKDLQKIEASAKDVVIGLAASGRTPYVIGALQYAQSIGCLTGAISCSAGAEIAAHADIAILPVVGGEVVTGSTRMKSGTAQKLVLNMLSTGAMIKMGKVFGNLMVDVKPSNLKLIERQKRIVMLATDCTKEEAATTLDQADYNCKLAIFIILSAIKASEAKKILDLHQGFIRNALASLK